MEKLAKFVVLIPLSVLSCMWAGYVLMLQWGWFIAPVFGIAVTYVQAVGVTAFLNMVTSPNPKEGAPEPSLAYIVALAITRPALFLLVGWLIHVVVVK